MRKPLALFMIIFALVGSVTVSPNVFAQEEPLDSTDQDSQRIEKQERTAQEHERLRPEPIDKTEPADREVHADKSPLKKHISEAVCKNKQKRLQGLITSRSKTVETVQAKFDMQRDRIAAFYERHKDKVADGEALRLAVKTAAEKAATDARAVKNAVFSLDCNKDVSTQLEAYHIALKQARESLKSYRQSALAFLKALKPVAGAKAAERTNE